MNAAASSESNDIRNPDVIIIGSGIGGLCAGALLTAYGKRPLILESHYAAGGAAHGFTVRNGAGDFKFDTGPSFFCGLSTKGSLNPLKQALDAVDEHVECVSYDSFDIDDIRAGHDGTVHMCVDESQTLLSVEKVAGKQAAVELGRFYQFMKPVYEAMRIPSLALRGDWRLVQILSHRPKWALSMLKLLPYTPNISRPVGDVMKKIGITDPFVKRILDIEAFLLSGLKTDATIMAEIAFMVGERALPKNIEYPIGGATAIIEALVRGITKKGGQIRLRSHVEEIMIENNTAKGVRLRNGDVIFAKHVFSNASLWDTIDKLIPKEYLPSSYRSAAIGTPIVESFMHAHIAIPADGLSHELVGHHALLIDNTMDISMPGNVVMLSIPTVWSPNMAPDGWHLIHAYTLEPYDRWPELKTDRAKYEQAKVDTAQPLFQAIRHVIPDLDQRLTHQHAICKLGSPLTHARFNRRYKGTYGAAIRAGEAEFEWPGDIPIHNLKRCSDSTFPGIGVPSSAAAGLIAANELTAASEHINLIAQLFPPEYDSMV